MRSSITAAFLAFIPWLPACASAPRADPGHVLAPDAVEIAYDVRGSGEPTIVLVHCWCGNREFWKHQIDELARDHRVVRIDLPGHGESGRNRAHWTVTGFAPDVQAVADQLGLQRMILVGHSMGGPVCLAAAARMPGRVLGVVGIDNLHDADRGMTKEQVEPFAASLEQAFEAGMRAALAQMAGAGNAELAEWLTREAVNADHAAAVALMRDFAKLDLPALFQGAGVPIRNVNSANSPWPTNVVANRKYADFDARILTGVGHFLQLEDPARFNPLLHAAIADVESAPRR